MKKKNNKWKYIVTFIKVILYLFAFYLNLNEL